MGTETIETYENGVLVATATHELTPEERYQRELAEEMNSVHEQALAAYKNWGTLTLAKKDAILKGLVKWALWKDGWLKLGVL